MPKDTDREVILKHLLCAVDLSSCSVATLSRAIELARLYGAHLDVLHVLDAAATATATLESRRADLLVHLRQMIDGCGDRQVSVNATVAVGEPSSEILLHARKHTTDLLVIGSCSLPRPRRFAPLGHTAKTLIAGARCPVLIVPEATASARDSAPATPRHVVCAVSSGASPGTLKHAVSLALKFGGRLSILHVLSGPDHQPSKADSALQEIRRAIPDDVHASFRIDELAVYVKVAEAVADEIVDITRVLAADLLVLGFRRDVFSEDTREAIVSSVVRDIGCDVLVVPVAASAEPSRSLAASGNRVSSASPP